MPTEELNEVKHQKEKEKILLVFPDLVVEVFHYFPKSKLGLHAVIPLLRSQSVTYPSVKSKNQTSNRQTVNLNALEARFF
jgi:hypothetical protein